MNVLHVDFLPKTVTQETVVAYRTLDVANAFVSAGVPDLTPMKLQKLMYFAHGWCLALSGVPLIDDKFEAWDYGPVLPDVYHAFKHFRGNPVTQISPRGAADLPAEAKPLITKILKQYGHLSGLTLSDMTHKEHSPWAQTREVCPGSIIENGAIKSYFEAMLTDG